MTTDAEFLDLAAAGARQEWNASPELRGAFRTSDEYVAFIFADASGNVAVAEDGWRKQYRSLTSLRAEFVTESDYVGWKKFETFRRVSAAPAGDRDSPSRGEGEAAWKAEWASSSALKAEFGTAADYAAYKKAEAAGRVRVLRGAAK